MEKHVLIPTDFSRNSWNALVYAFKLYHNTSCKFFLLNAFQVYYFPTDTLVPPKPGDYFFEKAKEESQRRLEELLEKIESLEVHPQHQIRTISSYNSVLGAVKEVITEKKIDILIMGTKGENNPLNLVYGSNAVNVMKSVTQCPVLVVPENSIAGEANKEIVFATNYKFFYRRRELSPLLEIAKNSGAPIRVLHIEDEGEEEELTEAQEIHKSVLEDCLGDCEFTFHTLTKVKTAAGIHSFIQSRESSLLALYHRKHHLFSGIFKKTLVQEIGFNPQVPVLILQEHR